MKFSLKSRDKDDKTNNNLTARKGRASKRLPKHPASRVRSYHAVTIAGPKKCAAADLLGDQPYLSSQAPLLPLMSCEHPNLCVCKYQHLDDRRGEMRRDTDFGLPERRYDLHERREGPGTRRSA